MAEPASSNSSREAAQNRWTALGMVGLFVVLIADTVYRLLLPGESQPAVADDLRTYYYPTYLSAYSQLASGSWPLWNPYQLCGLPRLGAIQGGILYPLHALYLVLPTSTALAVSTLLHLMIIAGGAVVFARRLGMMWYAALLAGVLVSMRGFYPSAIYFPNMLEASVWIAPGSVAILALARGSFARPLAGLGFCAGMSLLAGYPQSTVYVAYAWGALLCLLLLVERAAARRWIVALTGLGCAVALGSALASVQLLPSFELSQLGNRRLEPLSVTEMYPLGRLGGGAVTNFLRHHHFRGLTELPYYFGVVGLCLLPAAWFVRKRRGLALSFFALSGVTLLFSLGPATRLFDLYLALPLLDSFRLPTRIRFVSDFAFALAAAGGLDALARWLLRSAEPTTESPQSGGHFVLALTVGSIAIALSAGLWSEHRTSSLIALAVAALMGLAWLLARTPARIAVIGFMLLALAVVEITLTPANEMRISYMREIDMRAYHEASPIVDKLKKSRGRVWIMSPGLRKALPPKMASARGFRGLLDYEPATTRRQSEYFSYLHKGETIRSAQAVPFSGSVGLANRAGDPDAIRKRRRLLDLAGVSYFFTVPGMSKLNGLVKEFLRDWSYDLVVVDDHGNELWKKRNALPRAYTVYRVEPAPEVSQLMERISQDEYDPMRVSYAEGVEEYQEGEDVPARGTRARIVVDDPNRVEIKASLAAPGMIVLADTYYPGWRASVDGEEVEIHPVNHLFRGVMADAGRHEVVFEYRPQSVRRGLAISSAAALVCLVLALRPWGWRRGE